MNFNKLLSNNKFKIIFFSFIIVVCCNFHLLDQAQFPFITGDSGYPTLSSLLENWGTKRIGLWSQENNGSYYIYPTELPINLLIVGFHYLTINLISPYIILVIFLFLSSLLGIIGLFHLFKEVIAKVTFFKFIPLVLIYFLNPLVYTKYEMSHIWYVIGYGVMPLSLYLLTFKKIKSKGFWMGILLLPIIFAQIQLIVLFFIAFIYLSLTFKKLELKKVFVYIGSTLIINLYWFLPLLLSSKNEVGKRILVQQSDTFTKLSPTLTESIFNQGYIYHFFNASLGSLGSLRYIWYFIIFILQIYLLIYLLKLWISYKKKKYIILFLSIVFIHLLLSLATIPFIFDQIPQSIFRIPFVTLFREVYNIYFLKYFLLVIGYILVIQHIKFENKTKFNYNHYIVKMFVLIISIIVVIPYFIGNFITFTIPQRSLNYLDNSLTKIEKNPGKVLYFPLSSIGKFNKENPYYGRNVNLLNMIGSLDYSENEVSASGTYVGYIQQQINSYDKSSDNIKDNIARNLDKEFITLGTRYLLLDYKYFPIDKLNLASLESIIKRTDRFHVETENENYKLYATTAQSEFNLINNVEYTNVQGTNITTPTEYIQSNNTEDINKILKADKSASFTYYPFAKSNNSPINKIGENYEVSLNEPNFNTKSTLSYDYSNTPMNFSMVCENFVNSYVFQLTSQSMYIKVNNKDIYFPPIKFELKKTSSIKNKELYMKIDNQIVDFGTKCLKKATYNFENIKYKNIKSTIITNTNPKILKPYDWSQTVNCEDIAKNTMETYGISSEIKKEQLVIKTKSHVGCVNQNLNLESFKSYKVHIEYLESSEGRTDICIYDNFTQKCLQVQSQNINNINYKSKDIYFTTNEFNSQSIGIYLRSNSIDNRANTTVFRTIQLENFEDLSNLNSNVDIEPININIESGQKTKIIIPIKNLNNLISTNWSPISDCYKVEDRSFNDLGFSYKSKANFLTQVLSAKDHSACINQNISPTNASNFIFSLDSLRIKGNLPKVCIFSSISNKCEILIADEMQQDKPIMNAIDSVSLDHPLNINLYARAKDDLVSSAFETISSYSNIQMYAIPDFRELTIKYNQNLVDTTKIPADSSQILPQIYNVKSDNRYLSSNFNYSDNWKLLDLKTFKFAKHSMLNEISNVWVTDNHDYLMFFLPSMIFYPCFGIFLIFTILIIIFLLKSSSKSPEIIRIRVSGKNRVIKL